MSKDISERERGHLGESQGGFMGAGEGGLWRGVEDAGEKAEARVAEGGGGRSGQDYRGHRGGDAGGVWQRMLRSPAWPKVIPGVMLGLTLVVCVFVWQSMAAEQERELDGGRLRVEQRAMQLSEAVTQKLDATIRSIDIGLLHLRSVYVQDRAGFERAAGELMDMYPDGLVQAITVFGLDGRLRYSSYGRKDKRSFADREHFRVHLGRASDELFVSEPIVGRLSDMPVVLATRGVRDGSKLVGVLGIALRPDDLSDKLKALRMESEDTLAVVREDGSFIARSRALEAALKTKVPPDSPYLHATPGQRSLFRGESMLDGKNMLFAWHRLESWPLIVSVAVNEESELSGLRESQMRARQRALGMMIMALLLAGGMGAAIAKLARSQTRYSALFKGSSVPMLLIDPDMGWIVEANEAAGKFYGRTPGAMRRLPMSAINVTSEAEVAKEISLAKEQQGDCLMVKHRVAGGEVRQVEVRSCPMDVGGRTLVYAIIHDISERRRAEAAAALEAQRLAALLETATDAIHILDEHGNLVQYSGSFAAMLGYTMQEVVGMNVVEWHGQVGRLQVVEMMGDLTLDAKRFETRYRRKDGSLVDVEISAKSVRIDGKAFLYNSARDIGERKLVEQQQSIAAVAFESQEGMMVTDENSVILRVNEAFCEITGYSAQEIVGKTPRSLSSGKHAPSFYSEMWRAIRERGSWGGEIWNRRKSGEVYPEWLVITAVKNASGDVTHYVGALTDITERKAAEEEVRQLAFYDPLRGLPNRRLLYDRLKQAVVASARTERHGAVMFIDLDDFKTLNDTVGHAVGDELLKQVGERLRRCLRDVDTVARLGGDEFVVLLENLDSRANEAAEQTRGVAEKVQTALGEVYPLAEYKQHSTPSIGIVLFQGNVLSVDELLKRADVAMYQAKAAGRNTMRFFDPQMQDTVTARAEIESGLRAALAACEFVVHYQPMVDASGRLRKAEALVRWMHPRRGLLLPGEFIRVAEESGLIVPLGLNVLEQACLQLVEWSDRSGWQELKISVNVSAMQFRQIDFVEQVTAVIMRTGVDPGLVELELTESAVVDDIDEVIGRMSALKAMGVGFALDDFGTGYSSLAYLSKLPLDQLKIDRSFVMNIEGNENARVICAATIALAHSLKLAVVAEGVESEAERDFLSVAQGCELMQGYLFGRPLPVERFEAECQHRLAVD